MVKLAKDSRTIGVGWGPGHILSSVTVYRDELQRSLTVGLSSVEI